MNLISLSPAAVALLPFLLLFQAAQEEPGKDVHAPGSQAEVQGGGAGGGGRVLRLRRLEPGELKPEPGEMKPEPGELKPEPGELKPEPGDVQIIELQSDDRGYLGVTLTGAGDSPPVLGQVLDGSGAAQAGLRAGDRVRSVDGEQVQTVDDLLHLLAGRKAGERVTIGYERGDDGGTVSVVLGARAPRAAAPRERREQASEESHEAHRIDELMEHMGSMVDEWRSGGRDDEARRRALEGMRELRGMLREDGANPWWMPLPDGSRMFRFELPRSGGGEVPIPFWGQGDFGGPGGMEWRRSDREGGGSVEGLREDLKRLGEELRSLGRRLEELERSAPEGGGGTGTGSGRLRRMR